MFVSLSCSKNSVEQTHVSQVTGNKEVKNNEHFVDVQTISSFAEVIEYPVGGVDSSVKLRSSQKKLFKEINEVFEIPDSYGNPAYYIVNYKQEGDIMLSADNRVYPIQSYSLSGSFPIPSSSDNVELPSSLLAWMMNTSGTIGEIRKLNEEQTKDVAASWDICAIQFEITGDDNVLNSCMEDKKSSSKKRGRCSVYKSQLRNVTPLLETTWRQYGDSNDLVPLNCGIEEAPIGCVSIAVGQIINYHSVSKYSGKRKSQLLFDIAESADTKYACKGSSVDTKRKAAGVFVNEYGYSSAIYKEINYHNSGLIVNELNASRPVILRGGRQTTWFVFSSYVDGHAWVCDGYRQSKVYYSPWDCEAEDYYIRTTYHMNWGWGGIANGYYSFNDFNPRVPNFSSSLGSYNYKNGIIYNIKP